MTFFHEKLVKRQSKRDTTLGVLQNIRAGETGDMVKMNMLLEHCATLKTACDGFAEIFRSHKHSLWNASGGSTMASRLAMMEQRNLQANAKQPLSPGRKGGFSQM